MPHCPILEEHDHLTLCHPDRRAHGPDGPPKWMKKPLLRFTHELVISTEAYPDFLLHCT